MQKYTYICWIHTDAMITDARRKTQWQRQTQGDFFIKYFTSHFVCKVSKRVTQSLRVRGSWRPNITEIFWTQSYGRQRCVFLVLHGCSTGALESTLLGAGFPHYNSSLSVSNCLSSSVQFVGLILPSNSHAVIWTRLHASATSSDIWRPGCVTSAIFGMACVIVIERK